MKNKLLAGLFTGLFIFSLLIPNVNAATFSFSATVTKVIIDNGSGTYSGTGVGDSFSGNFTYGDNVTQAIDINTEPNERNWKFEGDSFMASISNGGISTNFSITGINIQNNWPSDADTVDFLNTLFGLNVSVGTLVDTWSSGGITNGGFEVHVPTPEDPDNENLFNGMLIEVSFVSYDTMLYSDLSYQSSPPSNADLALFLIEEADVDGNILYSAVGHLDTIPVCNDVPGNVSLTSPFGIPEEMTPTFKWKDDSCATWYKLYIINPSTGYKFVQWYEIEDGYSSYPEVNCSDGECTVLLDFELENGNYDWWVRGWNDFGNGEWSDGMSFTITGNENLPSKVTQISLSGQTTDSTPIFTWNHGPASTWYKLWVGYPNDDRVFGQWYDISEICSGETCSITLETELIDGDYEWYVKSWNDYGKVWSDGMTFSILTPKTYYRDNDDDGYGDPINSRTDRYNSTIRICNK